MLEQATPILSLFCEDAELDEVSRSYTIIIIVIISLLHLLLSLLNAIFHGLLCVQEWFCIDHRINFQQYVYVNNIQIDKKILK